jgi:hypothetical protein
MPRPLGGELHSKLNPRSFSPLVDPAKGIKHVDKDGTVTCIADNKMIYRAKDLKFDAYIFACPVYSPYSAESKVLPVIAKPSVSAPNMGAFIVCPESLCLGSIGRFCSIAITTGRSMLSELVLSGSSQG